MSNQRPYVLSIAGYDPTGGAGVLADVKTFEQIGCTGMAICTALTCQTEDEFYSSNWVTADDIKQQLLPLLERYDFSAVKIGLIESLDVLETILEFINQHSNNLTVQQVIWDPVFKASSGFSFHESIAQEQLLRIAERLSLITPNLNEATMLAGSNYHEKFIKELSLTCAVLLKGGHAEDHADDLLYINGEETILSGNRIANVTKHGTGCVLSSAIAGHMAIGQSMEIACTKAKGYVKNRLVNDGSGLMIHNFERVYD